MPYVPDEWRDGDRSLPASAERMRKLGSQYPQMVEDISTPGTAVHDALSATIADGAAVVSGRPVSAASFPTTAAGLQDAMDEAKTNGATLVLPPAEWVLDTPLTFDTSGPSEGLKMEGPTRGAAILRANFDNDAILTLDGSGVNGQFQRGGTIRDVTFKQASGKTGVDGISATAVWWLGMENVQFEALSGDGIVVPDRTGDISATIDHWASAGWSLNRVRFAGMDGYGINAPSGLGWSHVSLDHCYFSDNDAGGLYAGGHHISVKNCAFLANGLIGGDGAIKLDRMQLNIPQTFSAQQNEFDGNYGTAQLYLKAVVGFEIVLNRFVSKLNAGSTAHRETSVIQLSDAVDAQTAGYGNISNNTHRGVSGSLALNWINRAHPNATFNIEGDTRFDQSSSALVKAAGSTTPYVQSPYVVSAGGFLATRYVSGGALPAASATYRGQVRMVQGAAGVADRFVICRKDAADAYAWADLF